MCDPEMGSWVGVWMAYYESGRTIMDRKTFQDDEDWAQPVSIQKCEPEGLLCPPYAIGYSISRKQWSRFRIDYLREVDWKDGHWERLILGDKEKLVLKSLVTSHIYPENPRNQIQQKGKGLVILLHGSPGSGKTLTAETAAEGSKRALISASFGDLNRWQSSWSFEVRLQRILRYATMWEAILLLDEADVLLEARDDKNGDRNALVAVFLKELEYFSGIVFLTTNRIGAFDMAMKSRIHLALSNTPPGRETRRGLWVQFLGSIPRGESEVYADEKTLDALIPSNLNGREISNTVNTARTIARFEHIPVQLRHIQTVLEVREAFDASLAQAARGSNRLSGDSLVTPLSRMNSILLDD